jgi:hypothetical protein
MFTRYARAAITGFALHADSTWAVISSSQTQQRYLDFEVDFLALSGVDLVAFLGVGFLVFFAGLPVFFAFFLALIFALSRRGP